MARIERLVGRAFAESDPVTVFLRQRLRIVQQPIIGVLVEETRQADGAVVQISRVSLRISSLLRKRDL